MNAFAHLHFIFALPCNFAIFFPPQQTKITSLSLYMPLDIHVQTLLVCGVYVGTAVSTLILVHG